MSLPSPAVGGDDFTGIVNGASLECFRGSKKSARPGLATWTGLATLAGIAFFPSRPLQTFSTPTTFTRHTLRALNTRKPTLALLARFASLALLAPLAARTRRACPTPLPRRTLLAR